jgi:hypothetical protein
MRIRSVSFNNRKKAFLVRTHSKAFSFPYAKLEIRPGNGERVVRTSVDDEMGREGFTYALDDGKEGTVRIDQVLEYNQNPAYMRDLLLYELTLEAQKRVAGSSLSKREIVRRLGTSAAQLYRLLDQTNYRKSIDQLLALLNVLECEVDLVVRAKSA